MQIPIVNDQDEIIGHKEREEITTEDIYRVSYLVVIISQKNLTPSITNSYFVSTI
jgi:hypothetical protein